jgi:hypothetical protein
MLVDALLDDDDESDGDGGDDDGAGEGSHVGRGNSEGHRDASWGNTCLVTAHPETKSETPLALVQISLRPPSPKLHGKRGLVSLISLCVCAGGPPRQKCRQRSWFWVCVLMRPIS